MKKLIKNPVFIIIFVIVIGIIMYGIFGGSGAVVASDIVIVKKGDVVQEVSVTGIVKPAQSVDLGFERGGKISAVYASVGSIVGVGQQLAVLENSEALAQFNQAEADMKIVQAKVSGSSLSLEDAKRNLEDKRAEAYTKADDAVRNSADNFFTDPRTQNAKLKFQVNNVQLKIDAEWQRYVIENLLVSWKQEDASANISLVKTFLDKVWLALNTAAVDATVSQDDIIAWKNLISASQTNINTAIANMTSAVEKLKTAESDLLVNQTQVVKASANRDYYESLLFKGIIRAPIVAVVTKQEAKVGEIAVANTALISLISAGQYEIEANIPEADIAKVKIGDSAKVSLDAYGSDTFFDAAVTSIDPAETMIDGVATYKVKFQFSKPDERIRSGMTANIDISTDKRIGVLVVPSRAIATKSGRKVVQLVSGVTTSEVEVKTGLRGSDGNVEILEGLTLGQEVKITVQ